MKLFLKLFLISLLLSSCSANRYLLTDSNKDDKQFLIKKIKKAKSNGEISSHKPIIVIDGKPYRYSFELKEEKLTISKSDIKEINILKKETGISIYGVFGKNGVLLITTFIEKNN
ncbi:MAG: hypothetical protein IIC74_06630, partial [Bacteroidetes bacterium]|nr:hypothetical protein [Bacteroidota bacterium]